MIDQDVNRYGLLTIAEAWTPAALLRDDSSVRAMNAILQFAVQVLNVWMDLAVITETMFDPSQCPDHALSRIIQLHGNSDFTRAGYALQRRLAVVQGDLHENAGSHAAFRTAAGVVTGEPSLVRPWVIDAFVLDRSTFNWMLLDLSQSNVTHVMLIGDADDASIATRITQAAAASVTDEIHTQPCVNLTGWKGGSAGWVTSGTIELETTSISGEYACLVMDASDTTQSLFGPYETTKDSWERGSWFVSASTDEEFSVLIFADGRDHETENCYRLAVTLGPFGMMELFSRESGVESSLGSVVHRVGFDPTIPVMVEVMAIRGGTATRLKAFVAGFESGWIDDSSSTRPDGGYFGLAVDRAVSPNIILRVFAALNTEGP